MLRYEKRRNSGSSQINPEARVSPRVPHPESFPTLSRKVCPCGGGCPRCAVAQETEKTKNKTLSLKRQDVPSVPAPARIPPLVHRVLGSSGDVMDGASRADFESRFHHDFGDVRLHTDALASASARAVNALAYTWGRHIVFAEGQYAPAGSDGKNLLAHELAHVMQHGPPGNMPEQISSPEDSPERAADLAARQAMRGSFSGGDQPANSGRASPVLARRVANVNCVANQFGAPDDPRGGLETVDAIAIDLATQMAGDLATDSHTVFTGIPDQPSTSLQAFLDHFGLPVAAGAGFLNRLTGNVRPTQEAALGEELAIVSRRFAGVARLMGQGLSYNCPGTRELPLIGCAPGNCISGDAFSCPGNSLVAICQTFWDNFDDTARAQILIHEGMHIVFSNIVAGRIIGVVDEVTRGPGRNFNISGCYEAMLSDRTGADSHAQCPNVP